MIACARTHTHARTHARTHKHIHTRTHMHTLDTSHQHCCIAVVPLKLLTFSSLVAIIITAVLMALIPPVMVTMRSVEKLSDEMLTRAVLRSRTVFMKLPPFPITLPVSLPDINRRRVRMESSDWLLRIPIPPPAPPPAAGEVIW